MLTISELFIYPVKSLGGISLASSRVTEHGLEYDRRWMLIDSNNRFISQREIASLSLFKTQLTESGIHVEHKLNGASLIIPFQPQTNIFITAEVWSDKCKALLVSNEASEWFSDMLSFSCRLVFMPQTTRRYVDGRYASHKEITSFTDGYPILLISQASLNDLNSRLSEPLLINRFRPGVVFIGGYPFEEDTMEHFTISGIQFYGVKLCARCVVTTISQESSVKSKEPLKTLATYRLHNSNVYFGQNVIHHGTGIIKTGDIIEVRKRKPASSI